MELLSSSYVLNGEAGGLLLFAGIVVAFAAAHAGKLFGPRHAQQHRTMGAVHLAVLTVGAVDASRALVLGRDAARLGLAYDVALGVSGVLVSVTAARDFGAAHDETRFVKNKASGTLEDHATVTRGEMWEHSFFELLLLCQIVYIHAVCALTRADPDDVALRALALLLVTGPWHFRYLVPVNSFSKNFADKESAWTLIGVMYRLKKWQFVAYKHVLCHGLNITLALRGSEGLAQDPSFRFYWMAVSWSCARGAARRGDDGAGDSRRRRRHGVLPADAGEEAAHGAGHDAQAAEAPHGHRQRGRARRRPQGGPPRGGRVVLPQLHAPRPRARQHGADDRRRLRRRAVPVVRGLRSFVIGTVPRRITPTPPTPPRSRPR